MTERSPTRVVIVDDQALMRQGLKTLLELEPGIEVVGTAVNGVDALNFVSQHHPDVVLMDLRMPVMDGVTATQAILHRDPGVRVLVLTTFDDDESIFAALEAGASGYVLKDTPSDQLARDIQAVHRGEASLSPGVARKVIDEMRQRRQSGEIEPSSKSESLDADGHERLSEREREVLRLAAQGMSNREIGGRLFITEGTVKNHVSSILSKLHLRDRTQAVLYAKEQGWV